MPKGTGMEVPHAVLDPAKQSACRECKAGRTLEGRRTQGRETQHGKHCVTQLESLLRRRAEQGRETQHKKHCVTECERTLRSSFL